MKYIIVIIFLILCTGPVYSQPPKTVKKAATLKRQTKTETQDWIKEKIEGFTRSYNKPEYSNYGTRTYEVSFSDCNMILKYIWYDNMPGYNNDRTDLLMTSIYKIPLQSLSKLSFIKIQEDYQIIIKIKTNESLIESTIIDKSKYTDETKKELTNSISLYIPQSLLIDNLPERLTSAFNNLIELCGGKVTKEVF